MYCRCCGKSYATGKLLNEKVSAAKRIPCCRSGSIHDPCDVRQILAINVCASFSCRSGWKGVLMLTCPREVARPFPMGSSKDFPDGGSIPRDSNEQMLTRSEVECRIPICAARASKTALCPSPLRASVYRAPQNPPEPASAVDLVNGE